MTKKLQNTDLPLIVVNQLKLFSYLYRLIGVAKETKLEKRMSYVRVGEVEDSLILQENKNLLTFKDMIKHIDYSYDYMFKNKELEFYFLKKFYNLTYSDKFYLDYGLEYDNYWWHRDNYLVLNPIELNEILIYRETYITMFKYNLFLDKMKQNFEFIDKKLNFFFEEIKPFSSNKFKYFLAGYLDLLGNFSFNFFIDKRIKFGFFFNITFKAIVPYNILHLLEKANDLFSMYKDIPEIYPLFYDFFFEKKKKDPLLNFYNFFKNYKKSKYSIKISKNKFKNLLFLKKLLRKKNKYKYLELKQNNQPKFLYEKYNKKKLRETRISLNYAFFVQKKKKEIKKSRNYFFVNLQKNNNNIKKNKIVNYYNFSDYLDIDEKKYVYMINSLDIILYRLIPFYKSYIIPFSCRFLNFYFIEFIIKNFSLNNFVDIIYLLKNLEIIFCENIYTGNLNFLFFIDILIYNSTET